MKLPVLMASMLCLGLAACASPNVGNPDGAAYAGTASSVYDASANPPRTSGTVSYDPNAPIPPDRAAMTPSGGALDISAPSPNRMPR